MPADDNLLTLVADIVSAHVSNNSVAAGDVATLIRSTYEALAKLDAPAVSPEPEKPAGAVTLRKSLASADRIISMIDGKPYSMLKRHLAQNGLTPAEYRERYNLPSDYPMTAKNYSERRRTLAQSIGLGRKKTAELQSASVAEHPHESDEAQVKTPSDDTAAPPAE